jgi:DNA-binding NtrC family response regulator
LGEKSPDSLGAVLPATEAQKAATTTIPATRSQGASRTTVVAPLGEGDWETAQIQTPAWTRSPTSPRSARIEREGAHELRVPLYPDRPLLLGRDSKCSVVFPGSSISREHARVWMREDGHWVVRDLGSRNGTALVRAGASTPPIRLPDRQDMPVAVGDVILLADGTNRIILEESEAVTATLPTQSAGSRYLAEAIQISARHALPVFLIGPSGSGKTHVARFIHESSKRPGQFILVNCGRLPTDPVQLQSELLGHAKGAFTGASADRVGKFHAADGGTLFLDEVEYLPSTAQDFLIDLLDGSGSFAPLGAPASRRWDAPKARLITASKKPLSRSGLRPDLCMRLAAADVIALPTLDQRREDIPGLVLDFLNEFGRQQAVYVEIDKEGLALLQAEPWPGQVRELESVVKVTAAREHARLASREGFSGGFALGAAAIREYLEYRRHVFGAEAPAEPELRTPGPERPHTNPHLKSPRHLTLEEVREALERHAGNKTRAAADLGIAVNTLKARMRALGLPG